MASSDLEPANRGGASLRSRIVYQCARADSSEPGPSPHSRHTISTSMARNTALASSWAWATTLPGSWPRLQMETFDLVEFFDVFTNVLSQRGDLFGEHKGVTGKSR
jgi:hypothetical protein